MNKKAIDSQNRENPRKALPKSKALSNIVWANQGGNATPLPATPLCYTVIKSCKC